MQQEVEERPAKRIRSEKPKAGEVVEPRLFAPFRALGLVTNQIPFVLQTRSYKGSSDGPKVHLLTCLGKSWSLWDAGKMTLLFVGSEAPHEISCLAMDGDAIWVSSGPFVIKYLRGKEVVRIKNPLELTLASIILFGSQLVALSEDGTRLFVWDTTENVLQSSIQFDSGFTATSIIHPATYLNKILISASQGSMQLWNIRNQTCIHKFPAASILISSHSSSVAQPITALAQSPAIDVIGVGFSSGEISVYDVRADERLMRMFMQDGGIRAVAFRSDGQPILASAGSTGHIAIWDLNEGGRLLHVIRGAHDGAVTMVNWIPGQPVLVSSGEDNSIKQWLFDSPTSAPRLLKHRSGHRAPPHLIRYYGEDGKQLLTASVDRSLRCTSVVRDSRSFELSQGSVAKKATSLSIPISSLKFSPITAISYSAARSKDWDDIVTVHSEDPFVRSWSMQNKRLGSHTFRFTVEDEKRKVSVGAVKSVCVTACGNFCLGSTSTGLILLWNLQSGIRRKTFMIGAAMHEELRPPPGLKKEQPSVTGLATDSLNRLVIASTSDGTIKFFDFHTTKLDHTVLLPASAVSMILHRGSGLLGVICGDSIIRIVDIETRKIVRELRGFCGKILDMTFSPDSRWLIATSVDSVVRTFDLPTGHLIDAFRTSSVATSISFSPTNDFLATSHENSVGIYLWANRAQYSQVSFQTLSEGDIVDAHLPLMQGDDDEVIEALHMPEKKNDIFVSPDQLAEELVTLTLLPRSRWQTLLNLEVIQHRNKPKEPPKPLEKAPFFLPTLPGVEQRFAVEEKNDDKPTKKTKRLQNAAGGSESTFLAKLTEQDHEGNYEEFFNYIKALSPAAIDLELRSLVTLDSLGLFMNALVRRLRSRKDFEAVQTYQSVFLRIHGEVLVGNPELREEMETLLAAQRSESERVLGLITSSLGTLDFVRDTL